MNVYYNKGFPGHYPVGTAAVIVARDRLHAVQLLMAEGKKHGLHIEYKDVHTTDFIQLDVSQGHCVILNDGNY